MISPQLTDGTDLLPSDVTVPQVKIPERYPPGGMGLNRKTGLPTLLLSFGVSMSHARAARIGCKRAITFYRPSFDPWKGLAVRIRAHSLGFGLGGGGW